MGTTPLFRNEFSVSYKPFCSMCNSLEPEFHIAVVLPGYNSCTSREINVKHMFYFYLHLILYQKHGTSISVTNKTQSEPKVFLAYSYRHSHTFFFKKKSRHNHTG